MIVYFSVILIGIILITGVCTAIYLGMTEQDKQAARDMAATVGIWLLLIAGVGLIAFGVRGLVNP